MSEAHVYPGSRSAPSTDGTVTYNARDLIPNGVKANIVLDDRTYTLRITRAGNLILTK